MINDVVLAKKDSQAGRLNITLPKAEFLHDISGAIKILTAN